MPAPKGGGPEWARLGGLLEQRRISLDPRWRDLTAFARERGINWRMCWDLEHNKRVSYRPDSLTAVEVAYRWAPGSIRRVLAGDDPLPAIDPEGLTPEQRRIVAGFVRALTEGNTGSGEGQRSA